MLWFSFSSGLVCATTSGKSFDTSREQFSVCFSLISCIDVCFFRFIIATALSDYYIGQIDGGEHVWIEPYHNQLASGIRFKLINRRAAVLELTFFFPSRSVQPESRCINFYDTSTYESDQLRSGLFYCFRMPKSATAWKYHFSRIIKIPFAFNLWNFKWAKLERL